MQITPAEDDTPRPREQIPYDLEAQAAAVRAAAELVAGSREQVRAEGDGAIAAMLERVEEHMVWVAVRLGQVAEGLRAAGWRPPPPPRPDLTGIVNADRHPPWTSPGRD